MLGVRGLIGNSVWAVTVLTPAFVATTLALVAALVAGMAVIVWAARRYRRPPPERFDPQNELERFRALQEQGELSDEELERIRARLDPAAPEEPRRPQPPPDRDSPPDAITRRDPSP